MFDAVVDGLTLERALVALGLFVLSTGVSTAIVVAYLVGIASDHFVAPVTGLGRRLPRPALRVAYGVGKNLLGLALVAIGIVLSIPGVPGQGLVTVFVGVLMLDVPGKRALELAIVRRPAVSRTIDRVRARFKRPPLVLDAAAGSRHEASELPRAER